MDALVEYDSKVIGQLVEKVLVYEGGRIELVMKNRESYEFIREAAQKMSA